MERRVGEGFTPLLTPINAGLDGILAATKTLDQIVPGFNTAVLSLTGALLSGVAALATIGFVAPAVKAGAGILAGAAGAAGGVPAAAFGTLLGIAKIGSDHEKEGAPLLENLNKERRSLDGGPNGPLHDGFGPDGRPLDDPGAADSHGRNILAPAPPPPPQTLNIQLHADPGTRAGIIDATPGLRVTLPAGPSVYLP